MNILRIEHSMENKIATTIECQHRWYSIAAIDELVKIIT